MSISSYSKSNKNRLALVIFSITSLFMFGAISQVQAKTISLGTNTDVIYTGGSFGIGTGVVGVNEKLRIEVPDGYWGLQFTRSGNPTGGIYTNSGNLYLENATGAQLNLNGTNIGIAGNLGVGTSTPAGLLHINDISSNNRIRFQKSATEWMDFNDGSSMDTQIEFITDGNKYYSLGVDDTDDFFKISNSGTLETGTAFTLNLSGNIGIGIANPTAKLHIVPGANPGLIANGSIQFPLMGSAGNVVIMADNTGALYSTTTASFFSSYSPSSLWGGTKNGVIYNGDAGVGNVGIGITNPVHKLSVAGTSYLNGQITTSLSGVGNRCLYVDSTGNVAAKSTDCGTATGGDNLGDHIATQNVRLGAYWLSGDGGNEGILVNSVGNVSVSTTSAAYTLNVGGDINLSGTLRVNGIPFSSGQWITNGTSIYYNTGNVGLGITNPGAKLDVVGALRNSLSTTHTLLGGAGNALVMTDNTGTIYATSTVAFLSGSSLWGGTKNGVIYNGDAGAGNVGIGITNPVHKLSVLGTTYLNGTLGVSGQITTALSGTGNRCAYVDASGNLLAKSTDCGTATGGDNLGDHIATQNIRLGAYWLSGDGGNEGVFVNSVGNVGVGITNPVHKLSVAGTSYLNGQVTTNLSGTGNRCLYVDPTGNLLAKSTDCSTATGTDNFAVPDDFGIGFGNPVTFSAYFSGSTAGNYLRFITNNSERMRINSVGNIGIGTTNPNAKLHVFGTTLIEGNFLVGIGGSTLNVINGGNFTYATNILFANTAGNVGIGTTAPGSRLHIITGAAPGIINTGSTQLSLLGGAGNRSVMADNTGTLYQGLISEASSAVNIGGGVIFKRTPVANINYTALASDYIIGYTSLSANRTLTLPNALCVAGRNFVIVNETNSTYSVIVDPEGATTISGLTTMSLAANNSIPVYCNGTSWFIY